MSPIARTKTLFIFKSAVLGAKLMWTVAHKGKGLAQFTVFAGVNITFGQ